MQIWIIIVQVHVHILGGAGVTLRHAVRVRGVGPGGDAGQQDHQHRNRHLDWRAEWRVVSGNWEIFPGKIEYFLFMSQIDRYF